ncbi:MAG: glycosyltransferase [Planctomycetota bacterium]
MENVAIVAIGRNEGDRCRTCLDAAIKLIGDPSRVIYVDSGSTDGSPEHARSLGVTVVDLDMSQPFTAARARNAGLAEVPAEAAFVQFIDADCELVDGWLETAAWALDSDPKLAGVAGRRRERQPDATAYNKLCDMEWDTPVGEAAAVGGDAMFRRKALDAVDGYDPTMIAGEEPEMCLRMRKLGWRLRRLDAEMTRHDAAMTSWKQWWNRNKRAGHAYAETLDRHPPTGAKEVRSNYVLGLSLPFNATLASAGVIAMTIVALVVESPARRSFAIVFGIALLLVLPVIASAYVLLFKRIRTFRTARGDDPSDAATYAKWVLLGKVPQAMGQLKYRWNKLRGRSSGIIEYK